MKSLPFAAALLLVTSTTWAQHAGHDPMPPSSEASGSPSEDPAQAPQHEHETTGPESAHEMSGPLGVPMSRSGSGTAWLPDSSPVLAHMFHAGDWALMLHYNVFAGFDAQASRRGAREWMSTNWVMLMAERPLLGGQLGLRSMLSAEPFTTAGASGYPLVLQSGETANGEPLHDRQHPHDLFMELAAIYRRELAAGFGFELYLAPAGEPALGPVAFPHRISAISDPLAALGHHWQDSTHISYGVLTGGVFTRFAKLEASWFNGTEPDENRYDLDLDVPNSWSTRVTVNPTRDWSGQVSYGFLRAPEVLEPELDLHRLTASATYNQPLGSRGNWATTAVWGRNMPTTEDPATNAFLLETNLRLGGNTFFGRGEVIEKTGHDLVLPESFGHDPFTVGALALGYVRDLGEWGGVVPGIGIRGAVNFVGEELAPVYGTRFPVGGMVFVQLTPAEM